MRVTWDEPKRQSNILKHGLDFADLTEEFFLSSHTAAAKHGRMLAVGNVGGMRVVAVIYRPLGWKRFPSFRCARQAKQKGTE